MIFLSNFESGLDTWKLIIPSIELNPSFVTSNFEKIMLENVKNLKSFES